MRLGFHIALIVALLGGLAGCDPLYGIDRQALVETMPVLPCVERSIKTTARVESVEYRQDGGKNDVFGSPTPIVHSYIYGTRDRKIWGIISVSELRDGKIELRDYHEVMGWPPPPQTEFDETRTEMLAIEARLATQCSIEELPASMKEVCQGGMCGKSPL